MINCEDNACAGCLSTTSAGYLDQSQRTPFYPASETELQNDRVAWAGRDLKDHIVPTPLPQAGMPSTTPGLSESGLEHLQGWRVHNLSGQSLHKVIRHWNLISKEFFLRSKLNLPSFSLMASCFVLSLYREVYKVLLIKLIA